MRDYGVVSPKFWIGETGKSLRGNLEAQVLALYLMTSPHASAIGVFHCPLMYMAHETGIGMEGATKGLRVLQEGGFCYYEEASEMIFVKRMAAYQIAEVVKPNDKRYGWLQREFDKLPSGRIKNEFFAIYCVAFGLKDNTQKVRGSKGASKPLPSQEQDQDKEQEQKISSEPVGSEPVSGFAIPLNDGSEWAVTTRKVAEWVQLFPAVDVEQELREMRAWSVANQSKRKTPRGIEAFAVRWLSKAQDTPGRSVRSGGSAEAFV